MMRFPEVYSYEKMMWDMLKSAICKASSEQGYTLRPIHCDKSTVLTKSARSGIPATGWEYSLGCVRIRLYQSHQAINSFIKEGGNDVFTQRDRSNLMKGNMNIEQIYPLGKTLTQKKTTTLPVVPQQCCHFSINIYYYKADG
jgi:hypothetical protein